jgi:prepilin-type N-terminal cleavage/methylation domain-containing protein
MMKVKRSMQRGVSLLEVMVTAFVVAVGLVVVMSSFVATAKSNRYSERMDIANTLLQLEMERTRNQPYSAIESEYGEYESDYADHPDYRKEIIVTQFGGSVKQIVVNIYFEKDRRRAQALTMIAQL